MPGWWVAPCSDLAKFSVTPDPPIRLQVSSANTFNLSTWFQSKLLLFYFNIINKDVRCSKFSWTKLMNYEYSEMSSFVSVLGSRQVLRHARPPNSASGRAPPVYCEGVDAPRNESTAPAVVRIDLIFQRRTRKLCKMKRA